MEYRKEHPRVLSNCHALNERCGCRISSVDVGTAHTYTRNRTGKVGVNELVGLNPTVVNGWTRPGTCEIVYYCVPRATVMFPNAECDVHWVPLAP